MDKKALLIEETHWESLYYTGILSQCMDLTADITASVFLLIPIAMSESERNAMDLNLALMQSARLNRNLGPDQLKLCNVPLDRTAVIDGWNPLGSDVKTKVEPALVVNESSDSESTQSSQVCVLKN